MKACFVVAVAIGAIALPLVAAPQAEVGHQRPAQFGFPDPSPQLPNRNACTADGRKLLRGQIEAWRQLQGLSRSQGEMICGLVENADDLGKFSGSAIERSLPEKTRAILKALGVELGQMDLKALLRELGYDLTNIDLRAAKAQCRQVQGDADRMATTEIGRLRNELAVCEGEI